MANQLALQVTLGAVDRMTAPLTASLNASRLLNTELRQLHANLRALRPELSATTHGIQSLATAERNAVQHIHNANAALNRQLNTLQRLHTLPPLPPPPPVPPLPPNPPPRPNPPPPPPPVPPLPDYRRQLDANRQIRQGLIGELMGVAAIGAAFAFPIQQAIKFESVMADVAKVVDFTGGATGKEFKSIGQELLKMSTVIPMAASGLGEIMAAAGSAGIAKKELLQFTQDAAKMGVAFDMSGKEAGAAMTGMRSIFALSQKEVVGLGDSFNYLSNSMDAKARDMLNIANRTGSMGKLFGLTGQQVGALSATFLALKSPPEIAATGMNALMLKLATADKQNKKFQEGLESLGLSAAGLKTSLKKDAQGTLLSFLQTVKKAPDVMGTLSDLFGAEYADDIAKLVLNLDVYQKSLGLVGDAQKYAGSMENEYQVRSATTANGLEILKNKAVALAINIGTLLLPAVNEIFGILGDGVSKITALAEKFPFLTKSIFLATGALLGLKLLMIGGLFFKTIISDMLIFGRMIIGFVIPVIQSLYTALMFNPFGVVIAGIAVLVAGLAFTIYKYWYPIKAFFTGFWDGLMLGIAPVIEALSPLQPLFSGIGSAVSGLINWFMQLFLPIQYTSAELQNCTNAGMAWGMAMGAVGSTIMSIITTVLQGWSLLGTFIGETVAAMVIWFTELGLRAIEIFANWHPMDQVFAAMQPVIDFFANLLPAQFVEFGKSLMTSLASGIMAAIGTVTGAASSIIDSVKGLFSAAGNASAVTDTALPAGQAAAANSAGWKLGQTSQVFESGKGGAGTISTGKGDRGGVSYGTYQLSSKVGTLAKFLKSTAYGQQFQGLSAGSAAFNAKWKQLAASDQNFGTAQHEFIKKTHYDPQMQELKKSGIDLSGKGAAVQDAIWSTSVQFGGGTSLIKKALAGKNAAALSDAQIISAIQDYKIANNNSLFSSSSAAVKAGTANRAVAEKQKLLKLAGAGTSANLTEQPIAAAKKAKAVVKDVPVETPKAKAAVKDVPVATPKAKAAVKGLPEMPKLPVIPVTASAVPPQNTDALKKVKTSGIVANQPVLPDLPPSQELAINIPEEHIKKFGRQPTTKSISEQTSAANALEIRGYLPETAPKSVPKKDMGLDGLFDVVMGAAINPLGTLITVIPSLVKSASQSPLNAIASATPSMDSVAQVRPFIEENRQASATSSPTAPMQTANTGTVYNQTFTITINAAPGMSPEQVAAQVERKFREQTSRNGQMFDGFY